MSCRIRSSRSRRRAGGASDACAAWIRADDRVIGLFGFLTSAKRAEVVLAAFADARRAIRRCGCSSSASRRRTSMSMRFAATASPSPATFPTKSSPRTLPPSTGWSTFAIRRAGETSGTLIRAFEAGKPVAVSDYAQFAEFPDDCVVKIPFGDREVEALADFFVRDFDRDGSLGAQRSGSSEARWTRRWMDT